MVKIFPNIYENILFIPRSPSVRFSGKKCQCTEYNSGQQGPGIYMHSDINKFS